MTAFSHEKIMTEQDLAVLGGGEVAYLREISPKTAKRMLEGATDAAGNPADVEIANIPASVRLFALHAADGTPIAIADSREGALANAIQQDLHMVQVH
ncbi:MAG: DUF1150 family protein [Pseudomonadota bacterium]